MIENNRNGENNSDASIELFQAFYWECPKCNRTNFEKPNVYKPTPDEKEEVFREITELEPWQELPETWEDFELFEKPHNVKCRTCRIHCRVKNDNIVIVCDESDDD